MSKVETNLDPLALDLDFISELIALTATDSEFLESLTKSIKEPPDSARCYRILSKWEENKNIKKFGTIKTTPMIGAYSLHPIEGFKIQGNSKDFAMSYWTCSQKLVTPDDQYIYWLSINFYMVVIGLSIVIPLSKRSIISCDFNQIKDNAFSFKSSLPLHGIAYLDFKGEENLGFEEIIGIVEDAFEHNLEMNQIQILDFADFIPGEVIG